MAYVEFDQQYAVRNSKNEQRSRLVGLAMKWGAKDEASANKILAISGIVVLVIAVGIYLWQKNGEDVRLGIPNQDLSDDQF